MAVAWLQPQGTADSETPRVMWTQDDPTWKTTTFPAKKKTKRDDLPDFPGAPRRNLAIPSAQQSTRRSPSRPPDLLLTSSIPARREVVRRLARESASSPAWHRVSTAALGVPRGWMRASSEFSDAVKVGVPCSCSTGGGAPPAVAGER
ncbi:hypothetical protein GUJ93_ZPchr0024g29061 [Zizania palustris]|uniref:Uncharacterized protein n=1 Tax=Zizania palustris TaxID=103762 RepID=A0A8J5QPE3_ZIZPA|nr:hypothetical protein GUJ93_ZPchr0024g29061 [Zizania palustris]